MDYMGMDFWFSAVMWIRILSDLFESIDPDSESGYRGIENAELTKNKKKSQRIIFFRVIIPD